MTTKTTMTAADYPLATAARSVSRRRPENRLPISRLKMFSPER